MGSVGKIIFTCSKPVRDRHFGVRCARLPAVRGLPCGFSNRRHVPIGHLQGRKWRARARLFGSDRKCGMLLLAGPRAIGYWCQEPDQQTATDTQGHLKLLLRAREVESYHNWVSGQPISIWR